MNDYFMSIALKEAKKAYKTNDVPIGAVIVKNNKIISKAHNKKNKTNIVTDHAEIIAINKAAKKLSSWRLDDCVLYTTLEPCSMCKSVIVESRIKTVFYLLESTYIDTFVNNSLKIRYNILNDKFKYASMINNFFKKRR